MLDVLLYVGDGILYDDVDYATRIEEQLASAGLQTARCHLNQLTAKPPPPARAYVLTGGETSVLSNVKWMNLSINTIRGLVKNADQEHYSVIGICLGSQIIAEALRPQSIISTTAIEVGLATITSERGQADLIVPAFHYQAISPEIASISNARIEWRNTHTAVQAFSYGMRVHGFQFHPDLSASDLHNLIDYHREVITRWNGDVAAAHRSVDLNAHRLRVDLFHTMVIDHISG